jgi:hypothetical protein
MPSRVSKAQENCAPGNSRPSCRSDDCCAVFESPGCADVRRVAQSLEETRAVLLKMEHALEDLRKQTVRLGEDEARVPDRDLTSLLALNRRAQLSLGTVFNPIEAKEAGTSLYVAKPASPEGR